MHQNKLVLNIQLLVVLVVLLGVISTTCWASPTTKSSTASSTETADLGDAPLLLDKIAGQYLNSQPADLKVIDGIHLVKVERDGRSIESSSSSSSPLSQVNDKSFMGAFENYLQGHELRIRLPELMPGEGGFGRAFKEALSGFEVAETETARRGGGGGGGGGHKGGGMGGIMMMGLMMGKMLGAIGLGGVGLLAMKALMVSALALMLSIIIGLKKLVSSGGDEGGHTVIHAGGHGGHGSDRRRREAAANIAYRAHSPAFSSKK